MRITMKSLKQTRELIIAFVLSVAITGTAFAAAPTSPQATGLEYNGLDALHQILSGAVVVISILFSIVSWFVVRLIGGIEKRLDAQETKVMGHETKLAVVEARCESRHC